MVASCQNGFNEFLIDPFTLETKHVNEPNQPRKPRALTYTEMMNGGQQQMDGATHQQEVSLQRRKDVYERSVEHLEQSFNTEADRIVDETEI